MSLKDFNDLHTHSGLHVVRTQLRAALEKEVEVQSIPLGSTAASFVSHDSPPLPPAAAAPRGDLDGAEPSPAPPALLGATINGGPGGDGPALAYENALTLDAALKRFVFVHPDGKVYDSERREVIKQAAAKLFMSPKLYGKWLDHEERLSIHQDHVEPIVREAEARRRGLPELLERYVYLYPTSEVWDTATREIVTINNLRIAIADCFDIWVKSDKRREVHKSRLVFDPTRKVSTETHINRFRGLPMLPDRDDSKCQAILQLAYHLCNNRYLEFHWLMCWLAFPLQHVGAKMDTAILMHSPQEGTGKSLLFDGVVKKIYGEYGATVGQHQLESQYSDWRSCKLFALFEEVLSRDQKFNYTGALKYMITGATQRLEQKFLASWEEANHMNSVFLSNEIQPWPLDSSDRRMHVLWPEFRLPQAQQRAVQAEIDNGGIEAFYAYLLAYPLRWPDEDMMPAMEAARARGDPALQGFLMACPNGSFDTRTKPPMTPEKVQLIECGRPSWEVFFRDWLAGALLVPVMPCLVEDLFQVFRRWADAGLENKVSQHKFSNYAAKIPGLQRRKDVRYNLGQDERKGRFFVPFQIPERYQVKGDENQADYFGRCVVEFQKAAGLDAA